MDPMVIGGGVLSVALLGGVGGFVYWKMNQKPPEEPHVDPVREQVRNKMLIIGVEMARADGNIGHDEKVWLDGWIEGNMDGTAKEKKAARAFIQEAIAGPGGQPVIDEAVSFVVANATDKEKGRIVDMMIAIAKADETVWSEEIEFVCAIGTKLGHDEADLREQLGKK